MDLSLRELMNMGNTERLRLSDDGALVKEGKGAFGRWMKVQWLNVKTFFSSSAKRRQIQENREVMYAFVRKIEDVYGKELADIAKTTLKSHIEGGRALTGYRVKAVVNQLRRESLQLFRNNVKVILGTSLQENPDKYLYAASKAVKLWKDVFSRYASEGLSVPQEVARYSPMIENIFANLSLSQEEWSQLSDATLHLMGKALDMLGMNHLENALKAEINRRLGKVTNESRELMRSALGALGEGDLEGMLKSIKKMAGRVNWLYRANKLFFPDKVKDLLGSNISMRDFVEDLPIYNTPEMDSAKDALEDWRLREGVKRLISALEDTRSMKEQTGIDKELQTIDLSRNILEAMMEKLGYSLEGFRSDGMVGVRENQILREALDVDVAEVRRLKNRVESFIKMLSSGRIDPEKALKAAYSLGNTCLYDGSALTSRFREFFSRRVMDEERLLQVKRGINALLAEREEVGEGSEVAFRTLVELGEYVSKQLGREVEDTEGVSLTKPMKECVQNLEREVSFLKSIGRQDGKLVFSDRELLKQFSERMTPGGDGKETYEVFPHVKVCRQFYRDYPRASYFIVHQDGEEEIGVHSYEHLAGEEKQHLEKEGIMKLRDLVGGDEQYLEKVSLYLTQSVFGSVYEFLGYANEKRCQFRLNGRPYIPVRANEESHYRISKNEMGEIRITALNRQSLKGVLRMDSRLGAVPWNILNPEKSYSVVGVDIVVPKEGEAKVERIFYQYQVEGAEVV